MKIEVICNDFIGYVDHYNKYTTQNGKIEVTKYSSIIIRILYYQPKSLNSQVRMTPKCNERLIDLQPQYDNSLFNENEMLNKLF